MLSLHLGKISTVCGLSGLTFTVTSKQEPKHGIYLNYGSYNFRERTVYLNKKINMYRLQINVGFDPRRKHKLCSVGKK